MEQRRRATGRLEIGVLLIAVLMLGAYFRVTGLNWDQGQHLHPDERHMTMVSSAVRTQGYDGYVDYRALPPGCTEAGGYLDSYCSPLNPFNRGYGGRGAYVYGTLPLILTRVTAEWLDGACLNAADPEHRPAVLPALAARVLFDVDVSGCQQPYFSGYGTVHLVGRMLAALLDLGAVCLTFLIGRRLYGSAVGLLGAALLALSVMPIQQAHFYTVDSFATFFVVLALYFVVLAAQSGRGDQRPGTRGHGLGINLVASRYPLIAFSLAGLTTGLAVACKLSVWPLALMVALAAVWFSLRAGLARFAEHFLGRGLPLLLLAGLMAFVGFRLAQPYAFAGGGRHTIDRNAEEWNWIPAEIYDRWASLYDGLPVAVRAVFLPDARFLGNASFSRQTMSGEIDAPPGHQWTDRTPLLFPWRNMVVWGMGLPLGLAAWAGWGLVAVELLRSALRRRQAASDLALAVSTPDPSRWSLLPWTWGTLFFLYQGTQWVKSMRYILPIYPVFALFAAYALVRLWHWLGTAAARAQVARWGRVALQILRYGAVGLVLVGTLAWALAYTRIVNRTSTRVEASRWMYQNVPRAATLYYESAEDAGKLQLSVPARTTIARDAPLSVQFSLPQGGRLSAVDFNYLASMDAGCGDATLQVSLASDAQGAQVVKEVQAHWSASGRDMLQSTAGAGAGADPASETWPAAWSGRTSAHGTPLRVPLDGVEVAAGQPYYLVVRLLAWEGDEEDGSLPAECAGPLIAESSVIANEHWDDGLPLRMEGLDAFGGLYQGLSTSSSGEVQNYNEDTSEKRALLQMWLDEADYLVLSSNRLYASIPRLPLRYPLTTEYYRALFAGELGFEVAAQFSSYMALGPFQFPDQENPFPVLLEPDYDWRSGPVSVPLPPAEEAFSVYDHPTVTIFRKSAGYSSERVAEVLNRVPADRAIWMTPRQASQSPDALLMDAQTRAEQEAGGTWSEMFDRDSPVNRYPALGVAMWWLAITLIGLSAFPLLYATLPTLADRGYPLARVVGLLLLAYLTWLLASLHVLPNTRTTIFRVLGLLVLAGGGVAWLKRQELRAYLRIHWRTILCTEGLYLALFLFWVWVRSRNPDLWHPVVGGEKPMDFAHLNAVIRSTWFPPYDPWFAGGYLNYYYFGYVLVSTLTKLTGVMPSFAYNLAVPLFFALTGMAAFSVAYNLSGRLGRSQDGLKGSTGGSLVAGLAALLFTVLVGNLGEIQLLLDGFVMVSNSTFQSTIPGLTRLVSALQGLWQVLAHDVQLPFRPEWWYWNPTRMIPIGPDEFIAPINEFPAFTFLYADLHAHMLSFPLQLVALSLVVHWARGGWQRTRGWWPSLLLGGLVIGSLRAVNTWDLPTWTLMGVAGIALGLWQAHERGGRLDWPGLLWRAVLLAGLGYVMFLPYKYASAYSSLELWNQSRTPLDTFLLMHGIQLFPVVTLLGAAAWGWLRRFRHAGPDPMLTVVLLVATGALLLIVFALTLMGYSVAPVVVPLGALAVLLLFDPDQPLSRRLAFLMTAMSMAIFLGVEVVVLKGDLGRMNTVFKFYLQAWLMISIAAAVALAEIVQRLPRLLPAFPEVRYAWSLAMAGLLLAGALFLPLGIRARATDRMAPEAPRTLDGMRYMRDAVQYEQGVTIPLLGDYLALQWMQDNLRGSPTIMETISYPQSEYKWAGRVSIYTGLPSVVGWRWHEIQQRQAVAGQMVDWRQYDVRDFYTTTNQTLAWGILERYDVQYVYVGPYERAYMASEMELAQFVASAAPGSTASDLRPASARKFEAWVAEGRLRPVYQAQGVTIYEVVRQ